MHPHQTPGDADATELMPARGLPAASADGDALAAGERLGRYRIESLLGRGGMGEVYRAEQIEPVRRTVALKLLRQRRLDARHLAYFEVERQLLAQMRHPAIAQIYDAGATDQGHPYFAMEFIDGTPVTTYCLERELALRPRISLFIAICQGVQHAHHKGVIHRDLKPGNILVDQVDGNPVPKIIDFGIATAAARASGGDLERAGTPDYMSPEQAGTDPSSVDTRSDVYSLGVVLYELLVGARPGTSHETVAGTPRTTLRRPSEQLATLPPGQAQAFARSQGLSWPRMRRALRELDCVVLKAMHFERAERYESAAALAADLQRFLDGQPVAAVPATRRYVWGKALVRHRVAIAAASVVLAALLGGLVLSLYGLQQAREQRAVALQRSLELEKVAAFQQSMLEGIDVQEMGLSMADSLRATMPELAATGEREALERALLLASPPDVARSLVEDNILQRAETAIAIDFSNDPALAADLRASVAQVRVALGLYVSAAEGFGMVAEHHGRMSGNGSVAALEARREQVAALSNAVRLDDAERVLAQALEAAAAMPPAHPTRMALELQQSQLLAARGDRPGALQQQKTLYARALQALGANDLLSVKVLEAMAVTEQQSGNRAAALAHMEAAVPLRQKLQGAAHAATLSSMGSLAVMRAVNGDLDGAIAVQRELARLHAGQLGREHPVALSARGNLANMMMDNGSAAEARAEAEAVLSSRTRVLGAEHPQTVRSRLNLSSLYARLDEFDRALALQRQVIESRTRTLGGEHPETVSILVNHAGTLVQAGRHAQALSELAGLVPLARRVLEPGHPQLQAALMMSARAAGEAGRPQAAIDTYREVLQLRLAQHRADAAPTVEAAWRLAQALRQAGRESEAMEMERQYVVPLLQADAAALAPDQARLAREIVQAREDAKATASR